MSCWADPKRSIGKNIDAKTGLCGTKAPKIGKYFRDCPPSNGPGSLSASGSHSTKSDRKCKGHSGGGSEKTPLGGLPSGFAGRARSPQSHPRVGAMSAWGGGWFGLLCPRIQNLIRPHAGLSVWEGGSEARRFASLQKNRHQRSQKESRPRVFRLKRAVCGPEVSAGRASGPGAGGVLTLSSKDRIERDPEGRDRICGGRFLACRGWP